MAGDNTVDPTSHTTATNSTANVSSSLLFLPSTGHVASTSHTGPLAINSTNVTDTPTTQIPGTGNEEGLSDGAVAVVIILVLLGLALATLLVYLKITGNMYRLLTCKVKVTKRRSSTSSSRRPLDVDDHEDEGQREDDLPVTREATMFTIDDFEPVQNDEYSRTGNAEEYYYDEVFGQSMFEDAATNASMRELYLVNEEEDDMFDVDVIVNSATAPTTPTTPTATTATSARKT